MTNRTMEREDLRPRKRAKMNNDPCLDSSPNTIVVLNPYLQSGSPAGKIKISKFPQELSILLNGVDIRIRLPGKRQVSNPGQMMRIRFHNPLLSSNYYGCYDHSKSLMEETSELETPESSKKNAAPNADESKETIDSDCMGLLNSVRTTPDEHGFLRFMLDSPPVSEERMSISPQGSSFPETRFNESLPSEYNPFILGGERPTEDNFVAF